MELSKSIQWSDSKFAFSKQACDPQDLTLRNKQVPMTPPPAPFELPPRFVLGQEVFILDSNGTDPTGLTTYLVLSNHEKDHAGQSLYRLMPSQEIVFRAAEKRLLEVSFSLGAQVRRRNETIGFIVTRRYVEEGARLYDLRDEQGRCLKGVKEAELVMSSGGMFSFATQMDQ